MPDVAYTFHVPFPDEGRYGILLVDSMAETVEVHTYSQARVLEDSATLGLLDWEEAIRSKGVVLTPLIRRGGAAVVVDMPETGRQLGVLIPARAGTSNLLDAEACVYRALVTQELEVAELFFLDVLTDGLVPLGEILYLDMQVLEDERFRAQGAGGKVLFTRLNVPHVRVPEVGKLYVTCLHQPRTTRGKSTKSATAITLAVNPWNVQLASAYVGPPGNVVKHLL
jgi:hypothetical protein